MEIGKIDERGVLWIHFQPIDRTYLDIHPELRIIVCPATGLDHIDLGACTKRGVEVLSLQGEAEFLRTITATAEHTIGLMLALLRRIPWAHNAVVADGQAHRADFQGTELKGKRLGLVGLGRVGMQVRVMAIWGLGMPVIFSERYNSLGRKSFGNVLEDSDILSLHAPLNDATRGMINEETLAQMKPGAYLINTARGGLIDEMALEKALLSGHLAGAALDFCETQTLRLYAKTNTNLLLTPHLGGNTVESRTKTDEFMQAKLERWLAQ